MKRDGVTILVFLSSSLFLAAAGAGCSSSPPPTPDSGLPPDAFVPPPDAAPECREDADCDDGLFCTGVESCEEGSCERAPTSCDDAIACTNDFCSEERRRCEHAPPDADGDGYGDAACLDERGDPLGNDCADDDATRFPGNHEVCDEDGHDEDCDLDTRGLTDADGDGVESSACCNPEETAGTPNCGPDCDDARAAVRPGGTEVCDGLDQDCNGTIDEGVSITSYVDADRDGYGDSTMVSMRCAGAVGFATMGGDCDDANVAVSPGQPEICDGIRNDCSALAADVSAISVDWYRDADGDGFGAAAGGVVSSCAPVSGHSLLDTDCDDGSAMISPAQAERCDGIDDDCSGAADFAIAPGDLEDDDGDGLVDLACAPLGTDCDDRDPASGPGEPERCDGRDNDCDAIVDEGATSVVYYRDLDGDGFGSPASGSIVACMPSVGYVARAGDCNDADPMRFPSAAERCNASDDDCDASVDEAPASDACALPGTTASVCVAGRCTVAECSAGLDDCNGRATDGCETTLGSDAAHCGRCGRACGGGESCEGGGCVCTGIRCSGACVDPLSDERYCGASDTCAFPGTSCSAAQVCSTGICTGSALFPGGYDRTPMMPIPRAREVTFTIDAPVPAQIVYTLDGSTPGASATTVSVPVGAAPPSFALAHMQTVRWRAIYPDGSAEPLRSFTHVVDTGAPRENHGYLGERVSINGAGPYVVVDPGAALTGVVDLQHWNSGPTGFCPSCATYTSVELEGVGNLGCDGMGNGGAYPGRTLPAFAFGGTAPFSPGVYRLMLHLALDFTCQTGGGEVVGLVVVRAPTGGK